MINRSSTLDPLRLGSVKPESPGRKEPTYRRNHDRRQLQLSRQGCPEAPWRPSEAPRLPSNLETKAVILDSKGQHSGKSLPISRTRDGKRADMVTLRKHLGHTRRLASAIKQGQSYVHLLQKEEQEEQQQEEEERQRVKREEQLRREQRPRSFSSDPNSDSDGWPQPAGTSWSGVNEARPRKKKRQSARPFTPLHHSLTSPLLSVAPREVIYRQLCCLSWLLEALTLDRSGRVGPLTACWDPKDPGRGRTTIKTLKKQRAIESQWEQFVSTKPQRVNIRRPHSSPGRLHAHRKSSLSALTSTTGGSVSSLVPCAEEDTESPRAAEDTDQPPSLCLRILSDVHQKVKKEMKSSQTSSCPAQPPLPISHLISNKAAALRDLKVAFDERVQETSQTYIDILELKASERLNSGLRRYGALSLMTESHGLPHHVTCMCQETEEPDNSNKNKHSNNMWLSTLLSSLPEEVCRERAVSRVLEKLRGFAAQQSLRVRPQVLLKVLGGLELWELCLPELCVAIQIAVEHVVQMSREEYDSWLSTRVSLPPSVPPSPPNTR